MKASFKLLLSVMIILLLAFSNGWCGKKVSTKPGAVVQEKSAITAGPVKPSFNKCPPGWIMKQVDSDTYTCIPRCPLSFKCPEGWIKECLDCGVRCNKEIAPPN